MIEKTVLDYLDQNMNVDVYLEMPQDNASSFCVIEKVGSSDGDRIYSAQIAVQSYADSLLNAATLNEQVKTAMEGLSSLVSICRCKLNSDYNYTDPTTKRYRYQAVFDIIHY